MMALIVVWLVALTTLISMIALIAALNWDNLEGMLNDEIPSIHLGPDGYLTDEFCCSGAAAMDGLPDHINREDGTYLAA